MTEYEGDFYKTVKTSLKSIIKNPDENLTKIQKAIFESHRIAVHSLQFLKMILLHCYEIGNFPNLDGTFETLVKCVMRTVSTCKGKQKAFPATEFLMVELKKFYNTHYFPLTWEDKPPSRTNLKGIIEYEAKGIVTMYENNIKYHFFDYVERYVNVVWKKKFLIEKIKRLNVVWKKKSTTTTGSENRKSRIRNLCNDLRKIKNDLLSVGTEYKSKKFYHEWISKQKELILPYKTFEKNNVLYDLKCHPFKYLPCMIYMMKIVEQDEQTMFNVFPMRNSIIPKYIRIDTDILKQLLNTKKLGAKEGLTKDDVWNFFFKTEKNVFKKPKYSFNYMISTDGVGVSVLFLRSDKVANKRLPKKEAISELYIDELECEDYSRLKNKNIVGIDPGKEDLIYCVDEINFFRYSQNQRRKETHFKKYRNILQEMKKEEINGETITEYETELSLYNRKTLDFLEFKNYVQTKNFINDTLFDFYNRYLFRKFKLRSFIDKRKSEQKMMRKFGNLFGSPEEAVVCIGDWEQKKNMKFKEPTLGIGMRRLFRRYKYEVYLVDEFRTSCKCFKCSGGDCKECITMPDPRPFKDGSLRLVHGLLRCKNVKCKCFWNRDRNGASNIRFCAVNAINGLDRPNYLRRGNSSDDF
jgi:hypothetical protein